jgi:hypothetical protein
MKPGCLAGRRQQRYDVDVTVDVIRPPVKEDDTATLGGAAFAYPILTSPASICFIEPNESRERALLAAV